MAYVSPNKKVENIFKEFLPINNSSPNKPIPGRRITPNRYNNRHDPPNNLKKPSTNIRKGGSKVVKAKRCIAKTLKGTRCKHRTTRKSGKCASH